MISYVFSAKICYNEGKAGAQPKQFFVLPTEENWQRYTGGNEPFVRMITMAPEKEGALDFITRLTNAGITVSVGHTGADAESAVQSTRSVRTRITAN